MTITINGTTGITAPSLTAVGALTGGALTASTEIFTAMPVLPVQSMVRLNTANGYGSTNTMIRRFTNVVTNQGTDITYADSATLGATFTINVAGVYGISSVDCFAAAGNMGISFNTSQPTLTIYTINVPDRLAQALIATANNVGACSTIVYLPAGSVIRAHTDGAATGSTHTALFTITRSS